LVEIILSVLFQPKQDWDQIRISFFKNKIGSNSKKTLSEHLWLVGDGRDDHCPVCLLDIWQDSKFATEPGYPKTAFKREPDTDPDM